MNEEILNLHFFRDEKIVRKTIEYFENALPAKNRYVVLIPQYNYRCKYVEENRDNIACVVYNSKEFWSYIGDVSIYKNVIIHYLTDNLVDFVLKNKNCNYTWIVWGGDLYTDLLVYLGYNLYSDPKQIDSIIKGMSVRYRFALWLTKIKQKIKSKKRIKAISYIPNICLNKYSQVIFEKYLPDFKGKNIINNFFYYPIDDIVPNEMMQFQEQGDNIMVGNSATFSNNHVYVFEKLSNVALGERKVIVPLSYGENKEYVLEKGKELLGDNFQPLLEFLPLSEYNKLLLNIGTFIFGHYRPEAYGNIVVALYSGATVFLDLNNPLYHFFKEMGLVIYSIEELPQVINYHLSIEERNHNKDLIRKNFNIELQKKMLIEIFGS